VDYPLLGFDDQIDNVWGPANLLYYPNDRQQTIPVDYKLAALPLSGPDLENVLSKGELNTGYRTHTFRYTLDQILVLSQPAEGACVRAVDGSVPVLSSNETAEIEKVAPYSKLDTILPDSPNQPPSTVFGKEPEHGWCYYFAKVDLAVQSGDWDRALSLSNEALAAGLSPSDPVEWMPFLLTYMMKNDVERVTTIARDIKKDEALEKQACDVFLEHHRGNPQTTAEMIDTLNFLFCHE
jgi:hypothetical protein